MIFANLTIEWKYQEVDIIIIILDTIIIRKDNKSKQIIKEIIGIHY